MQLVADEKHGVVSATDEDMARMFGEESWQDYLSKVRAKEAKVYALFSPYAAISLLCHYEPNEVFDRFGSGR